MTGRALLLVSGLILGLNAYATQRHEVSNVNCGGTWIRQGSSLFDVLDSCGTPLAREELTGGGAEIKVETLFYKLANKKTYITIRAGSVSKIELNRR